MIVRGLCSLLVIGFAFGIGMGRPALPAYADDDPENAVTLDVTLVTEAVVRVDPDASAEVVGTLVEGSVANVVWGLRKQDATGAIWVRARTPLAGWLPGAAIGITTLTPGNTSGLNYPTVQPPLTGTGTYIGPLPMPGSVQTP